MTLYVPGTDKLYESGMDNLIQHIRTNSVVANCQVIPHVGPDMGVRVTAGSIQGLGLVVAVAQTDLVVAPSGANARIDLVHVDMTTGVPAIIAGTPGAVPKPPAMPANSIELGIIGVGIGAINIQAGNIADRRLIAQSGSKFQGFISVGTNAATSGHLRLPNTGTIGVRNNTNTGDITLLRFDASHDAWFAQDQLTITNGGLATFIGSVGVAIGTNPATAGGLRLPNNVAIRVRNAANTGNGNAINWDAADNASWVLDAGSIFTFNLASGATEIWRFGNGFISPTNNTPATAGLFRMPNNVGIASRNAANSADYGVIYANTSNEIVIGGGYGTATGVTIVPAYVTIGANPANTGTIRLPSTTAIHWRNAANTGNIADIQTDASDRLILGDTVNPIYLQAGAGTLDIRYAVTALGGGAAPTVGTIGGSGPATAAQNSWLKILINGTASFLPVWR